MCHLYSCWWVNTLKLTNSSTSLVTLASGSWSCSEMLYQWQHNAKSYYDKQSRDFPPLEVGDKVRCRQNSEREWRKAEVMPRSYMLEDEYRCAYRRNRRQIISVPSDSPMTNLPTSWLLWVQDMHLYLRTSAKSSDTRETDRNSFTHSHYNQI